MRLRDFVALVFALFIAVAVVIFVRMLLGTKESQPSTPVETVHLTEILVASRDIGVGETVTSDMFRWKRWPEEALNAAYISKTNFQQDTYEGAIVQRRILAEEPLTQTDFVRLGDRSALSATITPGMRAISIPVDAPAVNGGLIKPGDLVDIVTTESQGGDFQSLVGRTVLEKIKVLAMDHHIDLKNVTKDHAESGYIPKTVTLEVTPNQAEVLAAAVKSGGNLFLSLYSVATLTEPIVENAGFTPTESQTADGGEESEPQQDVYYNPEVPQQQQSDVHNEIRIMRGSDKETFGGGGNF
jgi:pilus assembly protein CpaB